MGTTDILQRIQYESDVFKACFNTIIGLLLRYRWNSFILLKYHNKTISVLTHVITKLITSL